MSDGEFNEFGDADENNEFGYAGETGEAGDSIEVDTDDAIELDNIKPIQKRGPGRPRKNKPKQKLDRLGIIYKPSNEGQASDSELHTIEIIYENPQMFKKIFGLFKVYSVVQIGVVFTPEIMYMYAYDHSQEVKIRVEIFGKHMNKYYVENEIKMTFDTEIFHKIFQGINKDFTKICFVTNRNSQHSKIWMIFIDDDTEDSIYTIELGANRDDEQNLENIMEILNKEESYPISFDLSFKHLKRKMAELSNFTKKFRIEQERNNGVPTIYFACEASDGKVSNRSPLKNVGRMNLISTYDQALFTAPIFISHIKPLANSLISDNIKISVDENRDVIFTCLLDLDENQKNKSKITDSEKCRIKIASRLAFIS